MSDALPPDANVQQVAPVDLLFFRDPDLTNEQFLTVVRQTAHDFAKAALLARYKLLDIGARTGHSLCTKLDRIAENWTSIATHAERELALNHKPPTIQEEPQP